LLLDDEPDDELELPDDELDPLEVPPKPEPPKPKPEPEDDEPLDELELPDEKKLDEPELELELLPDVLPVPLVPAVFMPLFCWAFFWSTETPTPGNWCVRYRRGSPPC
jgi:hypothetical protein